ncbi:MAG: TetR/AcrR family transcriptional regulator [Gammaproteobacteria bacterium]
MAIPKRQQDAGAATYHHGDLREALVCSAEQLLEKRGVTGLSLREAAKLAGVSHAAPYRHFRSKAQLLEAVAKAGFERLASSLAMVRRDHPGDPRGQLIAAGHAYVEWALANPERTRLMYGGMMKSDNIPEDLHDSAEACYQAMYEVIDEGRETGIFRGLDTDSMVVSGWSAVHGLTMLLLGSGKLDPTGPEQVQQLVSTVCKSVLFGIYDHNKIEQVNSIDD